MVFRDPTRVEHQLLPARQLNSPADVGTPACPMPPCGPVATRALHVFLSTSPGVIPQDVRAALESRLANWRI